MLLGTLTTAPFEAYCPPLGLENYFMKGIRAEQSNSSSLVTENCNGILAYLKPLRTAISGTRPFLI